ncbi:CapA family protein [Bacteroidota bacterium]
MKNLLFTIYFSIFSLIVFGQDSIQVDTVSLIFVGDIMGHDPQIASAFDTATGSYDYDFTFKNIGHIVGNVDFAIANLEVTLAGQPYTGYPKFSSPDELASSCKKVGFDVLVTSNNHSCDRGKDGILRTLNILDSLKIKHTGTFRDSLERDTCNLLVLKKGNMSLGLLNYSYGTNGEPIPFPTKVNQIDTTLMLFDIEKSKKDSLDKLIVLVHWGLEYKSHPSQKQLSLSKFLFKNGVDIVIGSHPHVLQRIEYHAKTDTTKESFIVYSLGNFVSNQRTRKRDGGLMLELTLTKTNNETIISDMGYHLTWVNKPKINGKTNFEIIPCLEYENDNYKDLNQKSINSMKVFLTDSRTLLKKDNIGVKEIKYIP